MGVFHKMGYYSPFELNGLKIKADLNIFPLGLYDLLIGMDWLEKHKFMLDYYHKSFTFIDENSHKQIIKGITRKLSVRKIYAFQMKKSVRKGCKLYVVQLTEIDEKKKMELKIFHF